MFEKLEGFYRDIPSKRKVGEFSVRFSWQRPLPFAPMIQPLEHLFPEPTGMVASGLS